VRCGLRVAAPIVSPDSSPLLTHASPTAVVAYRGGLAVEARQFLADAAFLAERLPAAKHVLNVCRDRYQFTVGLAASLITGRVSLLPSTHTPEVIRQLVEFAPESRASLFDFAAMQRDFSELFGHRRVDLVPPEVLKNPYRRKTILPDLQTLYEAR